MTSQRIHRLRSASYVGRRRYFLTSCTFEKHAAFVDAPTVTAIAAQLLQRASKHAFEVLAYCFMPDHLHALVAGLENGSDFCAFVTDFKRATGFAYLKANRRRLWQKGYYERILRNTDADEEIVRYILENPARAGLAAAVGQYPYAWPRVARNSSSVELT